MNEEKYYRVRLHLSTALSDWVFECGVFANDPNLAVARAVKRVTGDFRTIDKVEVKVVK